MMSTSTDGGLTWSPIQLPADNPTGLGGQPVVQPNGNVIVPYSSGSDPLVPLDRRRRHLVGLDLRCNAPTFTAAAGDLRIHQLSSAEVDGEGRVYVVWHDCRFRSGCSANDIVMTTSLDGLTWTPVTRIPIDATTSGVDHFIPGIAATERPRAAAPISALGYHYYPVGNCTSRHAR